MASSTSPDPSSPSVLLDRFLADRPDGGLQEFDEWAAKQVDLQQSSELTAATRKMLEEWISAAGLLALNKETDQGSAFKAKEREGTGTGQAQKALCAGSQVGSFTLSRFIARGGMGQVWEAVDSNLKRTVALKLVLPGRVDRRSMELFAREARAGGRLSHPNLVTTLGYGNDDGLAWIAQELVEGSWTVKDSIDDLRSRDALPKGYYREVAELVASIADGMQAAHDAGVIHRDIKPQNILIGENDRPKVTDFGLARVSDDSFASMTGDIAGTWAYMSPEQVTAKRMGLDHRTDIFSLGVVLYELLTLRRPFDGDTSHETVSMILTEDPPSASTVRSQCPEELAVICAKAMEKSPSRRFSTMGELADDLRRHLRDEPIVARPPGAALRALKWSRRHPAISSAGAIAGLALVVVSLLALNLADRTRRLTETSASLRDLAQVATDRANDILSLSSTKYLEDLIEEAEELWPPHPDLLPRYEAWLEEAQALVDGSEEDQERGVKARPSLAAHEEKLAELASRSRPETREDRLEQARQHESYPELSSARGQLLWHMRMLGQEPWPDPGEEEARLAENPAPIAPRPLLEEARRLVGPDASDLGQATRGLLLAQRALELDVEENPTEFYPRAAMTLAWAEARHGDFESALLSMEGALAEQEAADELAREESGSEAPSSGLRNLEAEASLLEALIAGWSKGALAEREAELPALRQAIAALEVEVGERSFEDPEDDWWHRQLSKLVAGIKELHDPETGLAGETLQLPFGWGVRKRARFAGEVLDRTVTGADAAERWWEATIAIASSDAYSGLKLRPQLGLLPIGPDPETGLWEFAHLATGKPAVRDEEGKLTIEEETGLVFILIPGGTFTMGAQGADREAPNFAEGAMSYESPLHQVTLSPFFISKYEMTQGQWLRGTAASPSYFSEGTYDTDLRSPVEQVSWFDCMETMERLGILLPTEAQWEYTCRAGTSTPWHFGAEPESLAGKLNIADRSAVVAGAPWKTSADLEGHDDGAIVHAPVGQYPANSFGLHDVHGNVWEWCRDEYSATAYTKKARVDPLITGIGAPTRVYRGGAFNSPSRSVRSASRLEIEPDLRIGSMGLRPARSILSEDLGTTASSED